MRRLSQLAHPALLIVVLAVVYTFTVGRNPTGGPSEFDAAATYGIGLPSVTADDPFQTVYVPIELPAQIDLPGDNVTAEEVREAEGVPPDTTESTAVEPAHHEEPVATEEPVTPDRDVETDVAANVEQVSPKPEIFTHTIRSGETLSDIARAYAIDIETILAANSIPDPNRIRVGETLSIPNVKGVIHTVQRGESLWNIANYYEVTVQAIVDANDIANPNTLQVGQKLVVPGAQAIEAMRQRDAIVSPSGQLLRNFSWPTTGRISSRFGERWGRMHNGLDIAVPTGTPIRAAAAGTVTYSASMGTYGLLVIIDHGHGVETRYAHLSRLVAKVGQRVARGDLIAYSGNTGLSTGPHLHFEIRRNGVALDPSDFLR